MRVKAAASTPIRANQLSGGGLLAWKWFWLGLAVMLAASMLALLQPGRPLVTSRATPDASLWRKFVTPIETNLHSRLTLTRANLTAVHVSPDGRSAWAVGDGIVLRSDDEAATWQNGSAGQLIGQRKITDIAFSADGERAVAGTASGTLLFSNDRGDNWLAGDPTILQPEATLRPAHESSNAQSA